MSPPDETRIQAALGATYTVDLRERNAKLPALRDEMARAWL